MKKKLPGGLEDFLPVIPDWIFYILVVIGASIFFYYFARWLNKKMRPMQLQQVPREKAKKKVDKFGDLINQIKVKHLETQTFREGCFDLSAAMRRFLEEKTDLEFEEMTVGDIKKQVKSKTHIEFFSQLAKLQFGIKDPSEEQFHGICSFAKKAAKKGVKV